MTFWLIGIIFGLVHVYFFTKWCVVEHPIRDSEDKLALAISMLIVFVGTVSTVEHFCELLRYLFIITGVVK